MLKKMVKPVVCGLGLLIAAVTFAGVTHQAQSVQRKSQESHLLPLMPGPVIVKGGSHVPVRTIGPVVLTPKEKHVVSSDDPYVTVNLPVHAGAGEHWEISYCDDNLIQVLGEKNIGPVSEIVGAPGQSIFKFKALKSELAASRTTHILLRLVAADGHTIQYDNVTVTSTGA